MCFYSFILPAFSHLLHMKPFQLDESNLNNMQITKAIIFVGKSNKFKPYSSGHRYEQTIHYRNF